MYREMLTPTAYLICFVFKYRYDRRTYRNFLQSAKYCFKFNISHFRHICLKGRFTSVCAY